MIDIVYLILGLVAGVIVGIMAGYFWGKSSAYKSVDLSQQSSTISNLTNQITEMKAKFDSIEKAREDKEEYRRQLDEQREKRLKEWMESTQNLFKELSEKNKETAEEKEKRIKEWMEGTTKFFKQQRKHTEEFLKEQGKSREELEKKRDAQMKDMKKIIDTIARTIGGTQSRGQVGEEILRDVLSNSIKANVIVENLHTENGEVEFAWNLDDGNYIPIDSKLPDVFQLVDTYLGSDDIEEQRDIQKEIVRKLKKEIKRVQKYQNLSNTIDSCILVVPEAALDISPSLVSIGQCSNVFVCSYKDVFPVAHVIQDQYIRLKDEGDIGIYKQITKSLFQILEKIIKKTDTIDRGLTMIQNANETIKDEVAKGKRQNILVEENLEK